MSESLSHLTVAVCIPTYNQSAFLPLSVQSALNQTHKNVEVWISDDASTDSTPTVIKKFTELPNVHYFRHPNNLGISANNNWLLSQPSAEYIVRLDSDDLIAPNYVETLLKLMQQYPSAGYAHGAVAEIDEFGKYRRDRRLFNRPLFEEPEIALKKALTGYRVAANICMFRRKVLHDLEFYKKGMNFCEDWDLSVRIADSGFGNIYKDEILASYRVWTDQKNVRPKRKIDEINGALALYTGSLKEAYQKRSWPQSAILNQRKAYALNHSIALNSPVFNTEEKKAIKDLLIKVGDSMVLRLKIFLILNGFGFYFTTISRLKLWIKDKIKTLIKILK